MADSRTVTGNRDDLVLDASRCLRMRFSESSCRHCVDICPHGAVSLDGFLAINPNHCGGCLLCTAVCPTGAVEQSSDFSASLARLSRVPEPVLGCIRNNEQSNASLACLGGLSEEHLLALCHTMSGTLTLNLSRCSECPNSAMVQHLRQRLEVLLVAGLLEGGCNIVMAESAHDINYRDESVDRRSFFKSFRNSLFQSAAVILSTTNVPAVRQTPYGDKRLPERRNLLNLTRDGLSAAVDTRIREQFYCSIVCDETCSACQGCVAICPTGALQTEQSDAPPQFDQKLCSNCGLCAEFCLNEALQINPAVSRQHHPK
jgi:ferredoxin